MIPMDRQTLTLIAVVVCMIGLVAMFKELRTAKDDVEGLKGFSMNVMKQMQQAQAQPQIPVQAPKVEAPTAAAAATTEENAEDN